MKAKYINPYTDFGFKKIFGEEASKPLLIDFLNSLLPESNQVADLSFKNTEQLGQTELDRKVIYDIYCENKKGERFIVELQKARQNYFRERTIYYSTFPIREQAEKGNWNYNLKAVYCIGILDFTFDDYETEPERSKVVHTIKLKNQHGNVFYEKLTYIYLEMPNFSKTEAELATRLDKWLYFIKNLEDFQYIPSIFKDDIFVQAFEKAEIANFRQADLDNYEASLKVFRDNKAVFDYAKQSAYDEGRTAGITDGMKEGINLGIKEGIKEGINLGIKEGIKEGINLGIKEGRTGVAKSLKEVGVSVDIISATTGLTKKEIDEL